MSHNVDHRGLYGDLPDDWQLVAAPEPDRGATMRPVMDHTHARGRFFWQSRWWRTGEFLVPLRADLDEPTWGLVMTELLVHHALDDDDSADAILRRAIDNLPWHLYPGLQISGSDGRLITSGCCACLGDWRDWAGVLAGKSPWLGHDPDVSARLEGETVVIRASMAIAPGIEELVVQPEVIAIPADRFRQCLGEVERELLAIAERVETWACGLTDAETARQLAEGFRTSFAAGGE